MAHTTLDLSPPTTRGSTSDHGRSARFRRSKVPGEDRRTVDIGSAGRRAAYRPPEDVALRRDVVEAFRNRLERDATHTPDDDKAVAAALFGIARAEEALGRFEEARLALKRLSNTTTFWPAVWALERRLDRREGRVDGVERTLKAAKQQAGDPQKTLLGLEYARQCWLRGAPAVDVVQQVDDLGNEGGDFSALWAHCLSLDAALETGDDDQAMRRLTETIERVQRPDLRDVLNSRRAVWASVSGELGRAAATLDAIAERGRLGGDLGGLLAALYFDLDQRGAACRVLGRLGDAGQLGPAELVSSAMLQQRVCQAAGRADMLLDQAGQQDPTDWTSLRIRQAHLEHHDGRGHVGDADAGDAGAGDAGAGDAGAGDGGAVDGKAVTNAASALIDVLNRQLEGPMSTDERVTKLTRLGRLYEREADLAEAAAEVYREALLLEADHVPALRALGRLYSRRGNWAGLADLYEREIANMEGAPSIWRRHFQLAEIYRVRLDNAPRALEQYRRVLDHRPHYLPALKAAAGLLGNLGRWRELADLFLASVEAANSRRQKLYLLDKVAEVAENELQNYRVAIGAWQEILLLDEGHPRAFAALGRLYARTEAWDELIELNLRELELVADAEEEAVLRQKCAEIAERHLDDLGAAETHYRRALQVVPDFLPALEGLGRIYMRKERWDDIIEMSGRELAQTDDLGEALRRLGALAEIFELRLDRHDEAIRLYERILQFDPTNAHALASAIRLNRGLGRWEQVIGLTEQKLALTNEPRAYAGLHGELAMIAEWYQHDDARAFERYRAALDAEADNIHWLEGIARTWTNAAMSAAEVAGCLEDNVMAPMDGSVRDRYFKVIGRLRERDQQNADASRAYRMHGASDSLENQLVLQRAMAQAGERDVLRQFRRVNPQHELEGLLQIAREGLSVEDVASIEAAIDMLEPGERQWLLAELPVNVSAQFSSTDDPGDLRLSAELVAVLEGEPLYVDEDETITEALALRLRAVQARQAGDIDAYQRWTRREIDGRDSRDLAVSRLAELAEYAAATGQGDALGDILGEAARAGFPEMAAADSSAEPEADQLCSAEVTGAEDGPTLDRLYQALRDAGRFELLRDCLRAHSTRDSLTRSRRLYLFRTLATLYEEHLDDYEGASTALSHCWQLSEDVDYLRELVRISLCRDQLDRAIRFQQRHFESVGQSSDDERGGQRHLQSGVWLAELLLQADGRLEDGIDCLEHLLATYAPAEQSGADTARDDIASYKFARDHSADEDPATADLLEQARRHLAYAYFELGNAYRAVELFQSVLGDAPDADDIDDWRQLVAVYRDQLDDTVTAYELQAKLVARDHNADEPIADEPIADEPIADEPMATPDMDRWVDLALDADCLQDCADGLEEFADEAPPARASRLLARAAMLVAEDLMWPEEAVRLYTKALSVGPDAPASDAAGSDAAVDQADPDQWRLELIRRRAFCLAQISGQETETLREFRRLVDADPWEPTTYRGLSDLFSRSQAFDRARVADQILEVLGCSVDLDDRRTKTEPSRPISEAKIDAHLLGDGLDRGLMHALRAVMPLVEKVWADQMPQRKALDGIRLSKLDAQEGAQSLRCGLDGFGIDRFRVQAGDSGPSTPQVLSGSTPYIWLNRDQMNAADASAMRFVGGYCAALAWSGLSALLAVDGRRVWHLMEAVMVKQCGHGFGERVDAQTRRLVDQISSPFDTMARRRALAAIEPVADRLADIGCEGWPRAVEQFGCRAGLVLSGDVRAAVRGLLGFHGWDLALEAAETQTRLRRNDELRQLVAFAMSDDYLQARYAMGLSGAPSQLVR